MIRINPFDGDSYYAMFARLIYSRIKEGERFTYTDVMLEFLKKEEAEELLSKKKNLTSCTGYGDLKKAFMDIKEEITNRFGSESIEENGNKNKSFCYIGENPDPLADLRNAKAISDMKKYWQFCQNSAGFFPISWLDYFFKDSRDLLEIKDTQRKGEQVLVASEDRNLVNIELLPFLYDAIKGKKVLAIRYKPFDKDELLLTVSPHYLKEFNGRWYLFGHAIKDETEWKQPIAFDRIVGKPKEVSSGAAYVEAPAHYYENYFKNMVGVTHKESAKVEDVHVRAHTYYMFKLTETKKLHASQQVIVPWGKHAEGEYGEFSVHVEVNNEFIGRVLQMGDGLEVVSPQNVRKVFEQRAKNLLKRYKTAP